MYVCSHVCEQLAQSCYVERSDQDSNMRPLDCKTDAYNHYAITPWGVEKLRCHTNMRSHKSYMIETKSAHKIEFCADFRQSLSCTNLYPSIPSYTHRYYFQWFWARILWFSHDIERRAVSLDSDLLIVLAASISDGMAYLWSIIWFDSVITNEFNP